MQRHRLQAWIVIGVCVLIAVGSAIVAALPPNSGFIGWSSIIGAGCTTVLCLATIAVAVVFSRGARYKNSRIGSVIESHVFWLAYVAMLMPALTGIVIQGVKAMMILSGSN